MALGDLVTSGVYEYVSANRNSRAFASDRWSFIHIPKTAGSSFSQELANVLQPHYNIEVDYRKVTASGAGASFEQMMNAAIVAFSSHPSASRAKFVSGHFKYRSIKDVKELHGSKLISLVRNPAERLLSDYRFQLSEQHPPREAVRARYPTFRHFISDPINQDVMFKYLCEDMAQTAEECMEFISRTYTFIGVMEMYTFSIKMMFMLLGMRIDPSLTLRKAEGTTADKVVISKEDMVSLETYNQKDFFIWRRLVALFRPVTPEFFRFSDFDRLFNMLNGLPFRPI